MLNTLVTKAAMGRQVALLTGHFLSEIVRPSRPTTLAKVPSSWATLTPEWLTAALCSKTPGARVTGFTAGDASEGTTSRAPLTMAYNAEGRSAGLPVHVFAKATPKLTSRLLTVGAAGSFMEAQFYNTIRPTLDIETPVGYYAAADQKSGRSMFLLENVAETKRCAFGDVDTTYVDRAMAEDQMRLLATVHGTFWDSPRLESDLSWMNTSLQFQTNVNDLISFEKRSLVGLERAAEVIPPQLVGRGPHIWSAAMKSLAAHVDGPMTVLHSDVHLNNWYVTGDGRMGLSDWQVMTRGCWAMDVAYAVSSALTVADRRAWEDDLIEIYLDELKARGGALDLSSQHARHLYRQQMFHGLIFWLYTIGQGRLQPAMQPETVCRKNLERMAQAVVDLDSFAAL